MSQVKDSDVLKYYSKNKEFSRSETQQLEFLICENLLRKYLSNKKLNILELGAGSGHYTLMLAEMGHQISVLEPTTELNRINQEQIQRAGLAQQVTWFEADARDVKTQLSANQKFDIILSMGPMYHIFEQSEHKTLFQDLREYLKDEGLMLTVFLSKVGFLSYLIAKQPQVILADPEGVRDILLQGFDPQHPKDGSFRGFFSDLKSVGDLHHQTKWNLAGLHVLDPCIGGRDETFNQLSAQQKVAWAEVLAALSGDPNYWNSGRTWLALATKAQ